MFLPQNFPLGKPGGEWHNRNVKTLIVVALLVAVEAGAQITTQTTAELLPNEEWRQSYSLVSRDAFKLRSWISANARMLRDPALASVQLDYASLVVAAKFQRPEYIKTAAVQALAQRRMAELQDAECLLRSIASRVSMPRADEIAKRIEDERAQLYAIISGRQ